MSQADQVLHQLEIAQNHMDQASELAEAGACSAMLIHEINNLMTQIGGRASLALEFPDNQAYTKRALDIACHSSEQIRALCELFLSRNPTFEEKTPISNLSSAHKQALEFLSDADIHSYGFAFDCETELPELLISSAALEHILLNLYLNAVRASNRNSQSNTQQAQRSLFDHPGSFTDSIKLSAECSTWNNSCSPQSLKAEPEENPQHIVRITVEDTGIGMCPEQIAQALVPTGGQSKPTVGHGIGLAVCQRLIRQASGTLEIESIPGVGTKMIVSLPCQGPGAQDQSDPRRAA